MSARAACRLASLGFDRLYRYVGGQADWLAAGLPSEGKGAFTPRAEDIVKRDVPTCALDERMGDVRNRLTATEWRQCIVLNNQGIVLGRVRGKALEECADQRVEEVMEAGPTTVRPSEPLPALMERMRQQNVDTILVTTPEGVLVGVLRREDGECP